MLLPLLPYEVTAQQLQTRERQVTLTIRYKPGHPINRFRPSYAVGGCIDGHDKGETDRQLRPVNTQEMRSVGLKSLAYRLRTELAIDAWHWNPHGAWSNQTRKEGYWTSDATSDQPIQLSYGYRLPRRGNTIDQADNDGYSRLDDGDSETFWKSNPYLDKQFTAEANARHPQWIVIDFGARQKLNTIRLLWGIPFATRYEIQYGDFDDISDIGFNPPGMWHDFPYGRILRNRGGEVLIRLCRGPMKARFVRILMSEASGRPPVSGGDVRDALGYSMREIYLGFTGREGKFVDYVHHSMDHDRQTLTYVSSTDCWHRDMDRDDEVEQPGFDRVFQSGLTNGLSVLMPTELLYGTPENAVAEVQFLISRGYPIQRIELGEEPDGQYVTPEDYGALYVQFAKALHRVSPKLQLGGPSFQEILPDPTARKVKLDNGVWLERFLKYLKGHGQLQDYSFFSFEWYPFDDVCDPVAPQLARSSVMLTEALRNMQEHGLSRKIPTIISEYGYSAFASRAEIGIEGALLNSDIVGQFLSLGGDQAFLYGYTPGQVAKEVECTAGNNMLFSMDAEGTITNHFATYFAARLLTEEWLSPSDGWNEMYPVTLTQSETRRPTLITAYAVHRPKGLWSMLIINKDPAQGYVARIESYVPVFAGRVDAYQYSPSNYQLNDDLDNPYPIRSEPPEHSVTDSFNSVRLPPYSLTVIRGSSPKMFGRAGSQSGRAGRYLMFLK